MPPRTGLHFKKWVWVLGHDINPIVLATLVHSMRAASRTMPESAISFEALKKWNLRAGLVHLLQAILMLLASQLVPRIRGAGAVSWAFVPGSRSWRRAPRHRCDVSRCIT